LLNAISGIATETLPIGSAKTGKIAGAMGWNRIEKWLVLGQRQRKLIPLGISIIFMFR